MTGEKRDPERELRLARSLIRSVVLQLSDDRKTYNDNYKIGSNTFYELTQFLSRKRRVSR